MGKPAADEGRNRWASLRLHQRRTWMLLAACVVVAASCAGPSTPRGGTPEGSGARPTTTVARRPAPPLTSPPRSATSGATPTTAPPSAPASTAPPPTTHAPPAVPPRPSRATQVLAQLGTLPIKGRAPKTGYARDRFGPSWTDDVSVPGGHNGCDTRNDILRRDLTDITVKDGTRGCVVLTGILHDPYTARTIFFRRGRGTSNAVQIDHVVALSDAWQKGAQQLSDAQRRNLANDPLELLAVDGPTNASKGAGDAATWLPPNKGFRCRYVTLQVAVKAHYHLWVTQAEHDAITRIISGCSDAAIGPPGR